MIRHATSQVQEAKAHLPVRGMVLAYLAATRGNRNPASQRLTMQRLLVFASYCEESRIGVEQCCNARVVADFIEHLKETHPARKRGATVMSNVTLSGYVQCIRAALLWASQDDFCYTEFVSEKAVKKIARPRKDEVIIECFTDTHVRQLLAACKGEENPRMVARAKMCVHLLYSSGLRASELCALRLDCLHLDPFSAYLMVRQGKNRKDRRVPISEPMRRRLEDYCLTWRSGVPITSPVFPSRDGTESLTVAGLEQLFKRLGKRAGITDLRVSPHSMRHTYASNAIRAGMDIYTLQRILGHSSTSVTENYLRSLGSSDFDVYARAAPYLP